MADAGTLELVDVDTLAGLDFEVACEWATDKGEVCDKGAEWVGYAMCCGTATLRCEEHMRSLEALLRHMEDKGLKRDHVVCGHPLERMRWERLEG